MYLLDMSFVVLRMLWLLWDAIELVLDLDMRFC